VKSEYIVYFGIFAEIWQFLLCLFDCRA